MDLARDLGNLPGNVCTPKYLGERALALAAEFPDVKATVLERKDIEALGMGSFLSVTNGSEEPPRFIVVRVPRQPEEAEARRAGRQGHHVRHRRHLDQARRTTWTR